MAFLANECGRIVGSLLERSHLGNCRKKLVPIPTLSHGFPAFLFAGDGFCSRGFGGVASIRLSTSSLTRHRRLPRLRG
jgi:hypothetical protein